MARTQLLLFALLLAGVAGWLYSRQNAAQRALERETASLRAQLRGAEQSRQNDLTHLLADRLSQAPSPPTAIGAAAAAAAAAAASASAVAPVALSPSARQAKTMQRLEQLATTEHVDRTWSSETTDGANRAFAGVVGSRLQSADCRTTMCRFVVSSDSRDDQRELANQIAGVGPFAEDVWYQYDRDSTPPRTTLYVARHGVQLMAPPTPGSLRP